jgi:hypothetical protein
MDISQTSDIWWKNAIFYCLNALGGDVPQSGRQAHSDIVQAGACDIGRAGPSG